MDVNVRHSWYQGGPRLGNGFVEDDALRRFCWEGGFFEDCAQEEREKIEQDLEQFGDKCAEYVPMAMNSERFKPQLEQFDQWGRRVDKVHVGEGWKFFKGESAKEGLVALAYEKRANGRRHKHARVHQAIKLILFSPSSGMYSCPLAMTDGAAFAIESILKREKLPPRTVSELQNALQHLTSRDPAQFWTSGQWFTESQGGSDLSRATATVAVPHETPFATHKLYGKKWFTSAVDAEMTLTLASIQESANVPLSKERKALSMFFLRVKRDPQSRTDEEKAELDDALNGIQVQRLKDKMATRQLPTAELLLSGSDAHIVSSQGHGIKSVTPMLVITRLHNSLSSAAYMLRMRNLAIDFAHRRFAFGAPIVDKSLHVQSLFEYDMDTRGNLLFVLEFARLLGKEDAGVESERESALLRMISSFAKLFTAREVVRLMSDGVELFGAVGVMENHMSTLFRDATVMPIWEGTTNTLALDLVRLVSGKESSSITHLAEFLRESVRLPCSESAPALANLLDSTFADLGRCAGEPELLECNSRKLSMTLSRLWVAALAARTASRTGHAEDALLFEHWAKRCLREAQPLTTPLETATMRQTLFKALNGAPKDSRGKIRSYI